MATAHEIRDASVVRLVGCHQEMVVKELDAERALCVWLDFEMKGNEFRFPTAQRLVIVSGL